MPTKWLAALTLVLVFACEDADSIQQTSAIETNPESPTYTRPGSRSFDQVTEGDSTDRARFCDEAEATEQVAKMIEEPIIPDVSVGGVPLRGPTGDPMEADELLGRPEDGKFCDPGGRYANGFTFGPLQEIAVIFNEETRLVESIQVNSAYRGTLQGEVEHEGKREDVLIRTREKIRIGGRELGEYASSAQQASRRNSWLNHQNITLVYAMIRQTFFQGEPLEPGFNCVAERRCDVIYRSPDEETPQTTTLVFQDSGVTVQLSPEGQVLYVVASPVRKATFELGGVVSLGEPAAAPPPDAPEGAVAIGTVAPVLQSAVVEGCTIDLGADMTWGEFRTKCMPEGAERELARASYDVYAQRDAVSVAFDAVMLSFLRPTSTEPVFEDGEPPADSDKLFSVQYVRGFPAPSVQFVAARLAADYAARLQAHLAASLPPDAPPEHPFAALEIPVPPDLSTEPQRIGPLSFIGESGAPQSWIAWVVAAVQELYASLPEEQRALVAPGAVTDVALINPFVASVLSAFSFGRSDDAASFTVFQTTDNARWAVGISHFKQNNTSYRLIVEYSLFFGAVTAVTVQRGESEVDSVFSALAAASGVPDVTYYDLRLAGPMATWNPYRLGGDGILVGEPNRKNGTLSVQLARPEGGPLMLSVPGALMSDRAGYSVPLRGEREEFVAAHSVSLGGKETSLLFHVLPDGTIGRMQQGRFKGAYSLCPGLAIGFGDDVRAAISGWQAALGDANYQNCELVFHYTQDGNVLTGVSSISNRIQFETVAERATSVAMWR